MGDKISFQGELGAYSHQACQDNYPDMDPLPCPTFEDAIAAVKDGTAKLAMLPVENTTYGRVADFHRLLPESGLHVVGEAYVRVHINLLVVPGTKIEDVKSAHCHLVLIPQASEFLRAHGIRGVVSPDNARAARDVSEAGDKAHAALASELAAEVYGLDVLAQAIEDNDHNTTRFLVMSREMQFAPQEAEGNITSFIFRVRNIPAALYKAMGGFATNGVNMTKLESYMVDGRFTATQFYAEIDGHPDDAHVKRAMEELAYFTTELRVLGCYPSKRDRS